jgi:hypothetical protein
MGPEQEQRILLESLRGVASKTVAARTPQRFPAMAVVGELVSSCLVFDAPSGPALASALLRMR